MAQMDPLREDRWFEEHGFEPTKDRRIQVSIYAVSRNYGGPEEGGWWYDICEFTGVSERVEVSEVEAAKERLLKLFEDEQPRYPITSVLSDGPEYRVTFETRAGEFETEERPHYE
jgi:hypothetical protein